MRDLRERDKDYYGMNGALRKRFREEKKREERTGVLFGDSDTKIRLKDLSEEDQVGLGYMVEEGCWSKVRE